MPLPSDRLAAQTHRAALRWYAEATAEDIEWLCQWYLEHGPAGLAAELAARRTETLGLVGSEPRQWRRALSGRSPEDRRLTLLGCIQAARLADGLMAGYASKALDANLTADFRLGQAAALAGDLAELILEPWPFRQNPFEQSGEED